MTTVSELFEADGTSFIPDLFYCHREPWFNPHTVITLQQRPNEFYIRTKWQRLCRQWTTSDGQLAASMNLGQWNKPTAPFRRRRQSYVTAGPVQRVYHWHLGSYWEYGTSGSSNVLSPLMSSTWEPDSKSLPLYAKELPGGSIVILHLPTVSRPDHLPTRPVLSFTNYIATLPPWEQFLLRGIKFVHRPYEIIHRLTTKDHPTKTFLVSDGSQIGEKITFGWVVGSDKGQTYAVHSGSGHGTSTSHRAEAWGMLSALVFIKHLGQYTRETTFLSQRKLELHCDNAGLIQRVKNRMEYSTLYPNTTLAPDWELIEEIHAIAHEISPENITFHWVRGHQDEISNNLSTAEKYNVRADSLAKAWCKQSSQPTPPFPLLPSERCRFFLSNRSIHGHYVSETRRSYTLPNFFDYLRQRHKWSNATLQDIDWEAFKQAARNTAISRVQLTKLVHDKLPTRYECNKSNPLVDPKCHYCTSHETFLHLLQCKNPTSLAFRQQLLDDLATYFSQTGTSPQFSTMFLQSTQHWLDDPDTTTTASHGTENCAQRRIGWHLCPKGYLSMSWRQFYDDTKRFHKVTTLRNSIDFISGIIQILWEAQLTMWENHLQAQGKESTANAPRLKDKLQEYKIRIRLLHDKRELCLHARPSRSVFSLQLLLR